MGPVSAETRQQEIRESLLAGKYERLIDRESAYECLQKKYAAERQAAEKEKHLKPQSAYEHAVRKKSAANGHGRRTSNKRTKDTLFDKMAKSAMSSIGTQIGRAIARGILGSSIRRW